MHRIKTAADCVGEYCKVEEMKNTKKPVTSSDVAGFLILSDGFERYKKLAFYGIECQETCYNKLTSKKKWHKIKSKMVELFFRRV